ncbi:hypothetical protein D3C76_1188360 [compost metagenome]
MGDIQHDEAVRPRRCERMPRPGANHHALAPVHTPTAAIDLQLHDAGLRQHDLLEVMVMGGAFSGVGAQVQGRARHRSDLVGYRGLTYRKFTAVCRRARLSVCRTACGSGGGGIPIARDPGAAVYPTHRGEAIAGKPRSHKPKAWYRGEVNGVYRSLRCPRTPPPADHRPESTPAVVYPPRPAAASR